MRAQSQIQRTLGEAAAIERVAAILSQDQFDSRSAVGRRVCAEFDFCDQRGRPQLAGCLKALRNLEQRTTSLRECLWLICRDRQRHSLATTSSCEARPMMDYPRS